MFVVRLDGALLGADRGAPGSSAEQWVAEHFAQRMSELAHPGKFLTVHDGDASSEDAVVAVFRDGVRVGPVPPSGG